MLLLAVVALAALVWIVIAQPWRTAAAESAPPSPVVSSASSSPSASPAPTEPVPSPTPTTEPVAASAPPATPEPTPAMTAAPCRAGDLAVKAVTDQDTYAAGQSPKLSISLTNTGATNCTLNVGTTTQKFTIKSGDDVWWRSTDCQTEPSDMIVTLAAGQSVTSATPVTWDRTRSSVETCTATDRQRAPGGGASYHLSVEIAGVSAPQTKQFLLY